MKSNNMASLRNRLDEVFDEIRTGKIETKQAKELSNVAGKIISSVTAELKAAEINKTPHRIAYLLYNETKSTRG